MTLVLFGKRRRRRRRKRLGGGEEEEEKKKKRRKKHCCSCRDSLNLRGLPPIDPNVPYRKPHPENDELQLGKASVGSSKRSGEVVEPSPSPTSGGAELQQHAGLENSPTVHADTIKKGTCSEGDKKKESAKAELFELCAMKKWESPSFECCKEVGPSHMRQFTFKVIVKFEDQSKVTVVECFSAPMPKKKTAAEHAATGALWYLKHQGYFLKK